MQVPCIELLNWIFYKHQSSVNMEIIQKELLAEICISQAFGFLHIEGQFVQTII